MSRSHPSAFEPDHAPKPEKPQLQVVVHAGPLAGKGFLMSSDEMTFGRDLDNNISWDDSQVSRHHARLVRRDELLILEDLGSTNGTLVNGKPIEGEHILQPADIISIGSSVFGVKGFSAPHTQSLTQLSKQPPPPPDATFAAGPPPGPTMSSSRSAEGDEAPAPKSGGSGMNIMLVVGLVALVIFVLLAAAVTAYFLLPGDDTVAQGPEVVITAPVNQAQVSLNLPVTVQATASDPAGVSRMELWVDGTKTAEATSPAAQGQPTLTASLQWVPVTAGEHLLEIRAYNVRNVTGQPASITVVATGVSATEEPPTPTPLPPTPTVPTGPALTTLTDLNVRAGPGIEYDLVGLLPSGSQAEVIGRDENRQWWQIRFDPAPNDVGWVSADPSFATTANIESVPVAQIPATPTGTPTSTPTATPIPPTDTPTSTPLPPTATPTPTATATSTPSGAKITFDISPTVVQGGKCVDVSWSVENVKEVYYQGEGVPGLGDRQECPKETTLYRLRVIKQDDSEENREILVEVINPIVSSGMLTVGPDQTVDFDEGEVGGDDFKWDFGDDTRKFEVREGVQLAPKGQLDSLDQLSLAECASANFGEYSYIDGSDVTTDPANALVNGRTACFRTNQGRLGKLRFPEYSTDALKIEWLTWK